MCGPWAAVHSRRALVLRRHSFVSLWLGALVAVAALLGPGSAHALDKQGSANRGEVGGADSGFGVAGSVLFGAAIYNPTYAARPDNTGHALLRLAGHLDVDLIGARLSIPIDVNFFSDRDRSGLGKILPSEFDIIAGLTSTWPVARGALEFGVRAEGDFPVDQGTKTQSYIDARTRYSFALGEYFASLRDGLAGGDITGAATLGWFIINPTYAARPDNTGRALFRYGFHAGISYTPRFFFGFDATFFTDRYENPVVPSELDITFEIGSTLVDALAVHLAYERDMPIDRGGFSQHFVLLFLTWDTTIIEH